MPYATNPIATAASSHGPYAWPAMNRRAPPTPFASLGFACSAARISPTPITPKTTPRAPIPNRLTFVTGRRARASSSWRSSILSKSTRHARTSW